MQIDKGTKSAVDQRFISSLSAGREALFVPGCRPAEERRFVSVNPFHLSKLTDEQNQWLTSIWPLVYEQDEKRSSFLAEWPVYRTHLACSGINNFRSQWSFFNVFIMFGIWLLLWGLANKNPGLFLEFSWGKENSCPLCNKPCRYQVLLGRLS